MKKSSPDKFYSFWFHYNKPESKKRGKPVWTIHFKSVCYIAENIICSVNTQTHTRKRQPFGVVKGRAKDVTIINNTATIQ